MEEQMLGRQAKIVSPATLRRANVTMPRRGVERQPRHIGFLPGGAFDT
jgi:hypothetical protein